MVKGYVSLTSLLLCLPLKVVMRSVSSVALLSCFRASYAATATNSGAVEIWDLPTSVVRHTLQHPVSKNAQLLDSVSLSLALLHLQ